MRSSTFNSIFISSRQLSEPVRVHGLPAAARAWTSARYFAEGEGALLVLCPNDDIAADFADDAEALARATGQPPLEVLRFPTWEQSPYSTIAPSLRTRFQRCATLAALASSPARKMVVSTIAGACQATIPHALFKNLSISLRVGSSVESREALIRSLLRCGYLRNDSVEDPGVFAARGDLIDVFPPGFNNPIRVEIFGDEVERIRFFDPATQKTLNAEPPESVVIAPCREVLFHAETISQIREQAKAHADDLDMPRAARDPVLNSIQEGMAPDHGDAWAPFAYKTPGSLLDYFSSALQVIWSDELTCIQVWDQFLKDQREHFLESATSRIIVPAVPRLFQSGPFLERVARLPTLFLDQLQLSAPNDPLAVEADPSGNEVAPTHSRHFAGASSNEGLFKTARASLDDVDAKIALWRKQGFKTLIVASTESQAERVRFLLGQRNIPSLGDSPPRASEVSVQIGVLSAGFRWPAEGLVVLTEGEFFGSKHTKKKVRREAGASSSAQEWSELMSLSDLSPGDPVVHIDHGVGLYQGLVRLNLSGAPSDFLSVEYAGKDKLYLPVYRLNVVQKHAASGASVTLDRLGSQQFAKTKERVKDAVKKLAIDLVGLYAARQIREGFRFSGRDAAFQEFEADFPYEETPDQLAAIDATLADLEAGKIMDRLICGDVGYGKTEVAIRAAFRAVTDGKQVAILVPTTILAHQHEQSFRARLKNYPVTVESISRFKKQSAQKETLTRLAEGKVDILIGTHRILSKDVEFSDLGLVIVDEEHRFGVEHKEKLKTLKLNTPVLTLTATPIPRTLHMALSGLREISLIRTPPVDRQPVKTYVSRFDEELLRRAIEFELSRGGQVFFVHNRVQSIFEMSQKIRELVPHSKVGVGHGQMAERELERAMEDFYERRTNVLVCTAIIESGIDLPSANTIIINRADHFGLAQLYQIRGRVGRSDQRGYAYLLIPAEASISDDAKKRLEVIQKFVELGSGFNIASHDLEIRGGGDVLGPQQSGHIAAVGFELYTELLEDAIRELRGRPQAPEDSSLEPEIKAPFPAFLSEEYIPDVHQRLSLYRRLSASRDEAHLLDLESELKDRFGSLPPESLNLLWLIRIKILLKRVGVESLTVGPERVSLMPAKHSRLDPSRAIALVAAEPSNYQLLPDSKFVARCQFSGLRDLCLEVESLLGRLTAAEKTVTA